MSYVPLKVHVTRVAGIQESMEAMRLPMGGKGDTKGDRLGPKDAELAGRLIRAGNDHAKAMRGIIVWMTLEFQTGFMIEHETYRHGAEVLSTSSSMHGELKGLSGPALAEQKQADLVDKVYTRRMHMSYQLLRSIYYARRYHRHPDWQIFCRMIEGLPYAKELILAEKVK